MCVCHSVQQPLHDLQLPALSFEMVCYFGLMVRELKRRNNQFNELGIMVEGGVAGEMPLPQGCGKMAGYGGGCVNEITAPSTYYPLIFLSLKLSLSST